MLKQLNGSSPSSKNNQHVLGSFGHIPSLFDANLNDLIISTADDNETEPQSEKTVNFDGNYFDNLSKKVIDQRQPQKYFSFLYKYKFEKSNEYSFKSSHSKITSLDVKSKRNDELIVGSTNGMIIIPNESEKVYYNHHKKAVTKLLFHPKSHDAFLSGSADSNICIWNVKE